MSIIKDNWDKPRSKGDHLKPEDIRRLRVAFNQGRKPRDAAMEIKCSTRVAAKYFGQFRGVTVQHLAPAVDQPRPPAPRARFYKSNFEL